MTGPYSGVNTQSIPVGPNIICFYIFDFFMSSRKNKKQNIVIERHRNSIKVNNSNIYIHNPISFSFCRKIHYKETQTQKKRKEKR